jgi:hypothetical protein
LYLALFALDATGVGDAVIHLVPAALVLTVVALGWRWPSLAGAGFLLIAAAYAVAAWSHPTWIAAISLPLVVVGALFLASRTRPARMAG